MHQQPPQFILPDLVILCPMKGSTNPHYEKAGAESSAWIDSYNIFTDRKRAFFIQSCNELLVSHTYPYAGYEQFRTCCDFVNLLFVIDEKTDDQSGKGARATGQIFLDAMQHPEWPDDSTLGKVTKEFLVRFGRRAGRRNLRRFLKSFADYIDAVSTEAKLREVGEVLDLASFTLLRRNDSGVKLCLGLCEYALGIDLPDEVFEDPTFISVYWAAADMICWSNDVYSYDMEQAKGHTGNNVLTVLMKEKRIDLQTAADLVGVQFGIFMTRFLTDKERLPSWGPSVDASVARYINALGHWVIGNLRWSFESQRYFGVDHRKVKKTMVVTLTQKDTEV